MWFLRGSEQKGKNTSKIVTLSKHLSAHITKAYEVVEVKSQLFLASALLNIFFV